jgi:hypothetical protein
MTGGKLSNAETNVIKDKLKNGQGKAVGEPVMPIFDADGVVIGYERSLAPEMIQKMRKNDNISEMVGAWAGRHVEEATAGEFNKKLVGSLKKIWDRDKGKRKGEFVNLADTKNNTEIQNDAWNMIPKDTKDMILDQFGEDGFMVRKDMIDNAVGYRGLSLGEAWSGPSNMSHDTKKAIRDFATAVRGKNAYRDLTVATKAIQAGVSVAAKPHRTDFRLRRRSE